MAPASRRSTRRRARWPRGTRAFREPFHMNGRRYYSSAADRSEDRRDGQHRGCADRYGVRTRLACGAKHKTRVSHGRLLTCLLDVGWERRVTTSRFARTDSRRGKRLLPKGRKLPTSIVRLCKEKLMKGAKPKSKNELLPGTLEMLILKTL